MNLLGMSLIGERQGGLLAETCPGDFLGHISVGGKPQVSLLTEMHTRESIRFISVSREHVIHCPAGLGLCPKWDNTDGRSFAQ